MESQEPSASSLADARTWLEHGHRKLYALAAAVAVVLLAVLSLIPAGGVVSLARMEQLVNTAYETSGTHCARVSHGRDLCHLKAERCQGTLLVAPSSEGHFTIVSSTPDQLDSSACVKSEESVGGFE